MFQFCQHALRQSWVIYCSIIIHLKACLTPPVRQDSAGLLEQLLLSLLQNYIQLTVTTVVAFYKVYI